MSCLLITNKERGKKPGETDIDFWEDIVNGDPEPFTQKDLDIWGIGTKPFGITSIIKGGEGSGSWDGPGDPRFERETSEVYHGTAESKAEKIIRDGLLSMQGSIGTREVYATSDFAVSLEYALKRCFSDKDMGAIVVMDKNKFTDDVGGTKYGRIFTRDLMVPPSDIRRVELYKQSTLQSWKDLAWQVRNRRQPDPPLPKPDRVLYGSAKKAASDEVYIAFVLSDDKEKKFGILSIVKGGEGSGNFGHEGRPGEVGGSGEGGGEGKVSYGSPLEGNTMRDSDGKLTQANGDPLPDHVQAVYIPPGWKEVTFNPDQNASMVAKGLDEKGRPVYAYKAGANAESAEQKWARVSELDKVFDKAVHQNKEDMKSSDDSLRDKATCWNLVSQTGIRAGSEDDTKAEKQAYGATTLLGKHVFSTENGVELRYVGKKGVDLTIPVADPKLVSELLERAKTAGSDGQLFKVNDNQLLAYTKKIAGDDFMTKDLRTLVGTRTAYEAIKSFGSKIPTNEKEYKQMVKDVATIVSKKLGNSLTVALQSYIDPTVFSSWQGNWKGRELWQS